MRRVMRVTLTFALIFLMQNAHAELYDDLIIKKDAAVNAIILSAVIEPNLSERLNKAGGNVQAGQSVCRRFGGSGCSYVSSVGEGICRAGKGSGCSYVSSMGEGICRAGRGSGCSYVSSIGEGICRAGKGSGCSYVSSIGEGICRAGKGSGCSYVSSIGEGVCRAGGGSGCSYVGSVGEGICRAGGGSGCSYVSTAQQGLEKIPNKDRYWYWDEFSDQYGNTLWRCRGSQTGRFAENEKCAGQSKDDNRWPG